MSDPDAWFDERFDRDPGMWSTSVHAAQVALTVRLSLVMWAGIIWVWRRAWRVWVDAGDYTRVGT